jgi:hypothetical protein
MLEPLLGTNTFDQDRTKQYCFTLSGDSVDNASKNLFRALSFSLRSYACVISGLTRSVSYKTKSPIG